MPLRAPRVQPSERPQSAESTMLRGTLATSPFSPLSDGVNVHAEGIRASRRAHSLYLDKRALLRMAGHHQEKRPQPAGCTRLTTDT